MYVHPVMNILPSSIRSHHFLSPAILIFVSSAVSVITLVLKQPVPLLPLLSTLNLTTVTLFTNVLMDQSYKKAAEKLSTRTA